MVYSKNLIKVTWGGAISDHDVWTNGCHIVADGLIQNNQTTLQAIDMPALFEKIRSTYQSDSGHGMLPYASLEYVKAVEIGVDGKYLGEPRVYAPDQPFRGSSASNIHSFSDSLVVTLTTDKSRGLAKKGRIYPPAFALEIGSDGYVVPAQVSAYADAFKSLFQYIANVGESAVGGTTTQLVIASKVGAGQINTVTGVEVGNIFDVQTRRRNRLKEAYTAKKF